MDRNEFLLPMCETRAPVKEGLRSLKFWLRDKVRSKKPKKIKNTSSYYATHIQRAIFHFRPKSQEAKSITSC